MEQTKTVFAAIVGRPNVGKSSLLNKILGEKVAIVSNKPQTTRTKITGVLTQGETQLVFVDTPGMHKPRNKLSDFMVREIKSSTAGVDVILLVTDCDLRVRKTEEAMLAETAASKTPVVLVMNKIDLLKSKEEMLVKMAALARYGPDSIIPVSAVTGDGVDILVAKAKEFAKDGPHYFDDDTLTDQSERVLAAEMIREKLLYNLQDEIPHGVAVDIEKFKEREGAGILDIEANIYCEKESHKGIIIGKNGALLKKAGTEARIDLENFFETKVNLQCWVKIKEDWRNRDRLLKDFGYTTKR